MSKKDKKKPSDGPDSPEAGQGDTNGQITPPVVSLFKSFKHSKGGVILPFEMT